MMISKTNIARLNPCKDRFDNFVKEYGNKKFTLKQFLGLKRITHEDKMWVCFRLMPKTIAVKCAADITESVLHIYEAKYPNDFRPRKAIESIRSRDKTAARTAAARFAARFAARSGESDAWSITRGAWSAARFAARSARSDAWSITRAAWSAARFAESAPGGGAWFASHSNKEKQEKLSRTIIIRNWK